MVIFYVIIIVVSLVGIKIRRSEEELALYLSKDATNAIKGIFIMIVFLRHISMYVTNSGYDYSHFGDGLFTTIDWLLGQLIVVMFLFFSGYGVMISIQKKGNSYIEVIPKHRFLNTLLNFDVAVVVFAIAALIIHRPFTLKDFAFSLLGWESIGNSNWYIFVILVCYISTWFAFTLTMRKHGGRYVLGMLLNTIIVLIIAYVLCKLDKSRWWYDTIICYPLGMLFALYKDRFNKFVSKKSTYAVGMVISLALFVLSYATFNIPDTQFAYWGGIF